MTRRACEKVATLNGFIDAGNPAVSGVTIGGEETPRA